MVCCIERTGFHLKRGGHVCYILIYKKHKILGFWLHTITFTKMAEKLAETSEATAAATADGAKHMDVETSEPAAAQNCDEADAINGEVEANSKRVRDEEGSEGNDAKKTKVEKTPEEERLEEKLGEGEKPGRVSLGPKSFGSSVEMFDYFYKFLHYWPTDLNVNKVPKTKLFDYS